MAAIKKRQLKEEKERNLRGKKRRKKPTLRNFKACACAYAKDPVFPGKPKMKKVSSIE